jgi:hypothetical protein
MTLHAVIFCKLGCRPGRSAVRSRQKPHTSQRQ